MMLTHMFGLSALAVHVCNLTFNYQAQQCIVVQMEVPVGMEASQVVDAWPGSERCLTDGIYTPFDFAAV